MVKHDYEKSYDDLMMEAHFEFLMWETESKKTRKADKAKFKAQRLAKLHMKSLIEKGEF